MEYFENLSDDELQKIGFDLQLVEFKKPFKPISRGRLLEKIRKLVEHSNDSSYLKTKIERIKKKRHAQRIEENRECHNESTSAGNETDSLMDDQLYFYNPPNTKIIFCFDIDDINYVLSIKKNFHTNVPINEEDLEKMREWKDNFIFEDVLNIDEAYDKIFKNVKIEQTPEMKFQEKLRKMNEILSKHNPYTNALEMGNLKLQNYELFIESKPFGIVLKDHLQEGSKDLFKVKNYVVEQILLMLQTNPDSQFLINKMIDDIVLMNNRNMTLNQLKEYRDDEGEEVYIEIMSLERIISHKLTDHDIEGLRIIFEDPNIDIDDYYEPVIEFIENLLDDVDAVNDDGNADFTERVNILKFLLNNPNFHAYLFDNEIYNLILNMATQFIDEMKKDELSPETKSQVVSNMGLLLVALDVKKPFYKIDLSIHDNLYLEILPYFSLYNKMFFILERDKKYDPSVRNNIIIQKVALDNSPEANSIFNYLLRDERIDPSFNSNILLINAIKNNDIDKVKLLYSVLEPKYQGYFPRNVINAVKESNNKDMIYLFKISDEKIEIKLPSYTYRLVYSSGVVGGIYEIPSITLNINKSSIGEIKLVNPIDVQDNLSKGFFEPKVPIIPIIIGSKEFYNIIKPPNNISDPPLLLIPSSNIYDLELESLRYKNKKEVEYIVKKIQKFANK